jgi:PAS domain S-box-containing protein
MEKKKRKILAIDDNKDADAKNRYEKEHLAGLVEMRSIEPNLYHIATLNLLEDLRKENEARKKSEEALRESESKLKKAQQYAHLGSWTWNIKTNKLDWSDEMFNLYGLEKETFSGSLDEVIKSAIHPDDQIKLEQSNLLVIEHKQAIPLEYRVIWPDKSVHVVWAEAGEFLLDKESNPSILSGIVLDITKLRQAEEEIRKLNESLEQRVIERTNQLEAANRELESFSYSVSHDLQTPLRHINGFINLLKEKLSARFSEEEIRYMDIISSSAQDMGKLIDALLSFSRLNRIELRKTTIKTSEMVHLAIRFFMSETEERKITFKVEQLPDCTGDEQLIKQVWINLISNAIKYTRKNTDANIIIGSFRQESETVYFVKDNGVGFDMRYSEKLFKVFQRLHRTRDFEGIGIGLANVNNIILKHDGHCSGEGEVGKGATFYFSLPI